LRPRARSCFWRRWSSSGSGRGRANGTAFTLAFLLGQSVAFLGAFFVGSALTESEHRTATSYIELAAGVALLVIAVRGRPPHEPPEGGSSARTEALFARLERLTPRVSFGIGMWVPVALYLILGTRADDLMAHARIWITAHEQMLTFVTALARSVFSSSSTGSSALCHVTKAAAPIP
jgi:hypothetical protein